MDFEKIEVFSGGVADAELALIRIHVNPLTEGFVIDLGDGVPSDEHELKIFTGLPRGGVEIGVSHAHQAARNVQRVESETHDLDHVGAPTFVLPGEEAFVLTKGMQTIHRVGGRATTRFEFLDQATGDCSGLLVGGGITGG